MLHVLAHAGHVNTQRLFVTAMKIAMTSDATRAKMLTDSSAKQLLKQLIQCSMLADETIRQTANTALDSLSVDIAALVRRATQLKVQCTICV